MGNCLRLRRTPVHARVLQVLIFLKYLDPYNRTPGEGCMIRDNPVARIACFPWWGVVGSTLYLVGTGWGCLVSWRNLEEGEFTDGRCGSWF